MNRVFLCFSFLGLVVAASASKFTDCGSTTGQVSSVQVSNCPDGTDVCPLKRGTASNIVINFSSKAGTKTLTAVVHGVIGGIPIPFSLPQPDACKSGVTCPVTNGQAYTYSNNLQIRNSYPPLSVEVKYELKDENNNDMVCVKIPCKIE